MPPGWPAVTVAACATLTAFAVPGHTPPVVRPAAPIASASAPPPGVAAPGGSVPKSLQVPGSAGAPPRQLFVPDLIAAVPGGITAAQLARIRKLSGVRAVLAVDGGKVTVNGRSADVLGVSPQALRPWTPPVTAAGQRGLVRLSQGKLITTARRGRGCTWSAGKPYPVSAAVRAQVPFGGAARSSVPGADAVVNQARSAQLGLARNFAVLINAPGGEPDHPHRPGPVGHRRARRWSTWWLSLVTVGQLPVEHRRPGRACPRATCSCSRSRPPSTARGCPGRCWPRSARSRAATARTWPVHRRRPRPDAVPAVHLGGWGIDGVRPARRAGHHEPARRRALGRPPAVRRRRGQQRHGLPQAIFDYNHATWYVNEVLTLAAEYAQNYSRGTPLQAPGLGGHFARPSRRRPPR